MPLGFAAVRADETMAEAYAAVQVASWRAAYAGIVPAAFLARLSVDERAAAFRRRIAQAQSVCYLFTVDGTPAGIAALRKYPEGGREDGELSVLYFLPAYWGKGYGAQAMGVCLAGLRGMGFRRAALWVLCDNLRARRYYAKHGFLPTGQTQMVTLGVPECEYVRAL